MQSNLTWYCIQYCSDRIRAYTSEFKLASDIPYLALLSWAKWCLLWEFWLILTALYCHCTAHIFSFFLTLDMLIFVLFWFGHTDFSIFFWKCWFFFRGACCFFFNENKQADHWRVPRPANKVLGARRANKHDVAHLQAKTVPMNLIWNESAQWLLSNGIQKLCVMFIKTILFNHRKKSLGDTKEGIPCSLSIGSVYQCVYPMKIPREFRQVSTICQQVSQLSSLEIHNIPHS